MRDKFKRRSSGDFVGHLRGDVFDSLTSIPSGEFDGIQVWPVIAETGAGLHEAVLLELWPEVPSLPGHPADGLRPRLDATLIVRVRSSPWRVPAAVASEAWAYRSDADFTRLLLDFGTHGTWLTGYTLVPEYLGLPPGGSWSDLRSMRPADLPDRLADVSSYPITRGPERIFHCPFLI